MEAPPVSLRDPEFFKDPFAVYDRLRTEAPVFRSEELNAYLVTRYEDVQAVLNDAEAFSNNWIHKMRKTFRPQESVADLLAQGLPDPFVLLWADGIDHAYHADIVRPYLTTAALKQREAEVEALVQRTIDALKPDVELDLVDAFAIPISVGVMCAFLGLSIDHSDLVLRGADAEVALHGSFTSEEEGLRQARSWVELQRLLANEIEDRQRNPRSDALSGIANPSAREDGYVLSQYERVSLAKLLVIAGNETTRGLLSGCMLNLAKHPHLIPRLRGDRAAIDAFVEESLRMAPPVMNIYRVAARDTEIAGVEVKEGEIVIASLGAGNYDPNKFACPYEYSIDRENARRHLGFGFRLHYCMGSALARLEARLGIEKFLERFEAPHLIQGNPPVRHGSILVYSLAHLPGRLQERAQN